MRVVFCVYDFAKVNLRLQPWLTFCKAAEGLKQRGHSVYVLTDIDDPAQVAGVCVQSVLSLRGSNGKELRTRLKELQPDALVFMPTPLNIVTASWLDGIACRRIGFASYPFYNLRELYVGMRSLGWPDSRQYIRHSIIPRKLWLSAMHRRLDAIVVQSESTGARLENLLAGKLPTHFIPPGINLSEWPLFEGRRSTGNMLKLLYLGSASRIRGFDLLLQAFSLLDDERIHLKILARGAKRDALDGIRSRIDDLGLSERIVIEGGWVEKGRLVSEIQSADAVVQPFILVPSELPVTAMEVIACGTPVIGSAIDGLPSTIGSAGTVVRQGNPRSLAGVIRKLFVDASMLASWREGCRQQRSAMHSWDTVIDRWEALMHV